MKVLLVIVGLVLAAGAGAVGGALCTGMCPSSGPSGTVEAIQPPTVVTPGPAVLPAEAQQRMDALSMELGDLQSQIAALRAEKSRAPAGVPAAAATEVAAASNESTEAFAAIHRDAIIKVITDREADLERKAAEERKLREEQQLVARADRVATRLNMSEGQKQLLVGYYTSERARMEEVRVQARDIADGGTPGATREAFQAAQEWRTNELTRLFGTELGAQVRDAEGGDRRGVMGGNGGGNRRGGNGGNLGVAGPAAGGG
jgi:hypothetical protein